MADKILVVDDDMDSLKLIGLTLQRQGFEIAAANTGKQALEKAICKNPDLIMLDVMMPDMDDCGVVCRRLRAEPTTRTISIIMFTAKSMVDDKVAGFEAGADDYLTKPTHPAELVSRVRAVLARRQTYKPAERANPNLAIGFLGAKGGVGTTTLAMNVAAALGQKTPTALADFRLGQGSLGLSLVWTLYWHGEFVKPSAHQSDRARRRRGTRHAQQRDQTAIIVGASQGSAN